MSRLDTKDVSQKPCTHRCPLANSHRAVVVYLSDETATLMSNSGDSPILSLITRVMIGKAQRWSVWNQLKSSATKISILYTYSYTIIDESVKVPPRMEYL